MPDTPQTSSLRRDLLRDRRALERLLDAAWVGLIPCVDALGEGISARFKNQCHALRERLSDAFNLVILGDLNRGKSTLVNALSGAHVVPVDALPETALITHVRYGAQPRAFLDLAHGDRIELDPHKLHSAHLNAHLEGLDGDLNRAHVRLVVQAPEPALERLTLIDTPGLGDLLERDSDRMVADYLAHADGLIYVVSALSPLSHRERDFLQLAVAPLSPDKLCFAVNMVDLMSEDEQRRVIARVRDRIGRLFPHAGVFPISALCALQRACTPSEDGEGAQHPDMAAPHARDAALAADFEAFTQHLDLSILVQRDAVHLHRTVSAARRALSDLREDAVRVREAMLRAPSPPPEPPDPAPYTDALCQAHARLAQRSVAWMDAFIDRLEVELLPQLTHHAYDALQRHLPFYLSAKLRDAYAACWDAYANDLIAHVCDVAPQPEPALQPTPSPNDAGADIAFLPPELTTTSHALIVGQLATQALAPFAMPVALLQALWAFAGSADRELGDPVRQRRYQAHLVASLPDLKRTLAEAFNDAARVFLEATADHVRQALQREHQRRVEVAAQAQALHAQQAHHADAKRERLRAFEDVLKNVERELGVLGEGSA